MDTLYDLLGALPRDDAESLRTAFRRAVKSAHPDLRPDDPDAGVRFRQIVRANEILLDKDQRAVYDHLLVLAQQEKDPAAAHPIAAKVHKIASTVLALASLSIVTTGGYFLFMHMSMALAPSTSLAVAHATANDLTTRLSASIAAVSPVDAPDPAAISALLAAKAEGSAANPQKVSNAMAMATADTENASPTGSITSDQGTDSATLAHARAASVLAIAEANAAPADPEHVAQIDQTFTAPYVDRGLLFFREKKEDNPFPDLPPLKRADKPGHPKSLLATGGKGHEALPKVPLPVPRTLPRYGAERPRQPPPWSPQPWYVSASSN
jgi:hypothetical protein